MPKIPLVSAPIIEQSQPAGVRVNPNMTAPLAQAGENLGSAVQSVGELAHRVKQAQDYATVTKANTTLETAFHQFKAELSDPTNPENGDATTWGRRWEERQQAVKGQLAQDNGVQTLSEMSKIHLETITNDWSKVTQSTINTDATLRSLENAKGTVEADYSAKLRQGDVEGAKKAVMNAVPFGIIHQPDAELLVATADRKADHYAASDLIMQDAIAAEGALNQKDKDGKHAEFIHLDEDARLALTFEAHRRAVQLRSDTASDLFERKQAWLRGEGPDVPVDEVNGLVSRGRLTPAQAKQYLKPPKPDFNPEKFGPLMVEIAAYDPAKDTDRSVYAKLMSRAAYDPEIKGPAASDAVDLLKKMSDPKSELNTPAAKFGFEKIKDARETGLYGDPKMNDGIKMDPSSPESQAIRQKADTVQAANLAKLRKFISDNPKANEPEVQQFISDLHTDTGVVAARRLLVPAMLPSAPPNDDAVQKRLQDIIAGHRSAK